MGAITKTLYLQTIGNGCWFTRWNISSKNTEEHHVLWTQRMQSSITLPILIPQAPGWSECRPAMPGTTFQHLPNHSALTQHHTCILRGPLQYFCAAAHRWPDSFISCMRRLVSHRGTLFPCCGLEWCIVVKCTFRFIDSPSGLWCSSEAESVYTSTSPNWPLSVTVWRCS